jgi:glutathione S-transferase
MMKLYLGNKNYSSWSLRAWLVLAESGLVFDEVVIPMKKGDTPEIKRVSPSGRVPLLDDDGLLIWDSLAIAERVAEKVPSLWPTDANDRALARSMSAEMHSGFAALRNALPMNVRRRTHKRIAPDVAADLDRIYALWRGARGPFLFGEWSIADAMFTPVATRLITYQVELDPDVKRYVDAVLDRPSMRQWTADAERERESIAEYDAV